MTRDLRLLLLSGCIGIVVLILTGAIAVQVNDYEDGNVLTAGELNSEFGNIYSTLNNLDEENFADGFQLTPEFIDSALAGLGLIQNNISKALDIQVDDSTVEVITDTLQVKDLGISTAKINDLAVTEAKIANNAVTSAKIPNDAIGASEIAADAVGASELANNSVASGNIIDGTIATADIADDSVTKAKQPNITYTSPSGNQNNVVYSNAISGTINFPILGFGTISGPEATLTTTGRAVLVSLSPRPGSGPAYFRCSDLNQDVQVILKVNGSEVAKWTFDFAAVVNGPGFQNTHDFYRSFVYLDARTAGTYTYRYDITIANGPPGQDQCTYSNWAAAVYEL